MNDFNDMINGLKNFKDAAEDINGHHQAEIGDVLTDKFFKHYTDFNNIEEFMNTTGITVEDIQNHENESEKLDPIAKKYVNFKTFGDFIGQAFIDKTLSEHGINQY